MAKFPKVPVENQITTRSVVKIAIKFSPCIFQFILYPKAWIEFDYKYIAVWNCVRGIVVERLSIIDKPCWSRYTRKRKFAKLIGWYERMRIEKKIRRFCGILLSPAFLMREILRNEEINWYIRRGSCRASIQPNSNKKIRGSWKEKGQRGSSRDSMALGRGFTFSSYFFLSLYCRF